MIHGWRCLCITARYNRSLAQGRLRGPKVTAAERLHLDLAHCALAPHRVTQVMSRETQDPETQIALQGPKRPRQEDRLARSELPRSLSPRISMSPFIRGFQDNMTSWMSSLINQQDGCLRLVAQQA